MLQLEEARDRILAAIEPLPAESIPLIDAASRVLAGDLTAPLNLPVFDNSAMDGYAVRCDDLKATSESQPVSLRVIADIAAGAHAPTPLKPGTSARIFTGSPLPPGADAVVMQEDVRREGELVVFHEPVKPWENIRLRGEDVKAGDVVVRAGDRMSAGSISLLGALGVAAVSVHRRPVIGVLATGNELQESGAPLAPGQIYESNRAALSTLVRSAGGDPRIFPLVRDQLESTRAALHDAFQQCDIVITSGGVSVGELDFVKGAFQALGGKLDFWRIAIRPGKPFVFGTLDKKHLFGLPGNPVSAFVTALLLVCPAILRCQGARDVELPSHTAITEDALVNKGDRRHFMRVRIDTAGNAHLAGIQASHALSSLAGANGLVDVPPRTVVERGTQVRVLRFGW